MKDLREEIELAKQVEADIEAGIRSYDQTVRGLQLCLFGLVVLVVFLFVISGGGLCEKFLLRLLCSP